MKKKILLICAGALTFSACKDDEVGLPPGYPTVRFSKTTTALNATPGVQTATFEVSQTALLGYEANSQDITLTISAEWNADDGTAAHKSKIEATIGDAAIPTEGKITTTVTIPAGAEKATFSVKAKINSLITSKQEAKLNIAIVGVVSGPPLSYEGKTTLTFTGSSPLVSAPSVVWLENNGDSTNNHVRTNDTLWFGIDKTYYAPEVASTEYKVAVNRIPVGDASDSWGNIAQNQIFLKEDKVGVQISPTDRTAWNADDTISIRMVLAKQVEAGFDDTIATKFVVQKDLLKSKVSNDFTSIGASFELLTDAKVFLDTTADGSDSTFVLKLKEHDSIRIAIVPSTEDAFTRKQRTHEGAQDVDYGDLASTITIPATNHISVNGYQYFAVKITSGTGENMTTYYGYLRLRTFMHYDYYEGTASPSSAFEKVSMEFVYGEARDYTKE